LAAVSFAAAAAIWTARSVASGATEARTANAAPYTGTRAALTLLLTVPLTAALLYREIAQEAPATPVAETLETPEAPATPSTTKRLIERLVHVPPLPAEPAKIEAEARKTAPRAVDPGPAIGGKGQGGIPGVVPRPQPNPAPKLEMFGAGSPSRLTVTQSLAIPFTGEYQMFRTSSGSLPAAAGVETGTQLERVYGTKNGGSMETIAVQQFKPPIDLTHCRLGGGGGDVRGEDAGAGFDAVDGGGKRGGRRDGSDGDEA
jgi:hypothetical protein